MGEEEAGEGDLEEKGCRACCFGVGGVWGGCVDLSWVEVDCG